MGCNLCILQLNEQSLNNKALEIIVLLSVWKSDIFCISVHWLEGDVIFQVALDEYRPIAHSSRTEFRGGGTDIFGGVSFDGHPVNVDIYQSEKHSQFRIMNKSVAQKCCSLFAFLGLLEVISISIVEDILTEIFSFNRCLMVLGDLNVNFLAASVLMYSVMYWGFPRWIASVFIVQKRVIRCILRLHPRTSCRAYFRDPNTMTLPSLYYFTLVVFVRRHPELFKNFRKILQVLRITAVCIWM